MCLYIHKKERACNIYALIDCEIVKLFKCYIRLGYISVLEFILDIILTNEIFSRYVQS